MTALPLGDSSGIAADYDPGIGFADPVLQSQAAFRAIMTALAEPGTIQTLDTGIATPAGIAPAAAIILLTLADYETPVWLDPAPRRGAAGRWLKFHAGAPLCEAPGQASFAVLGQSGEGPSLAPFAIGTDQYPDRAATIVIECARLSGGPGVELSGPGIPTTRVIGPAGLWRGFWQEVADNGARYPLGVDLILAAGCEIIGLPRSTQIRQIGEGG